MYRLSVTLPEANSAITTGTSSVISNSNSSFNSSRTEEMSPGGGLDPAEASGPASKFRILARNGGIQGLDWENEGTWKGAFSFVQAADTQFGMIDHFERGHKDAPSWMDEVRKYFQSV